MKTQLSVALAFLTSALLADVLPKVTLVSVNQPSFSREVTVTYTLADAPAVITLDVLTNNVSIGEANITCLKGDINRLVQPTEQGMTRSFTWRSDKSWPDHKVENSTFRLCAWAEDNPPPYLVVNLLKASDNISYYTSADALPDGGLSNGVYRTSRIVLRRIPAGGVEWTMGSNLNDNTDAQREHAVTLASDYYIGIYEVTQDQWFRIMGNWPSFWSNVGYRSQRPVDQVSYYDIRESTNNKSDIAHQYPEPPNADSFLGKLRASTGIMFDLPTEAQWEFACRAGHEGTKWGDGSAYLGGADANAARLGRFLFNGGTPTGAKVKADANCTTDHSLMRTIVKSRSRSDR